MSRQTLVFFLSGSAALVDQLVWMRLLARALGSDATGVAVVLVAFMGGMAFGARTLGPRLANTERAARTYFGLQLCVAGWALATAWLVPALGVVGEGARPWAALLVLLPPTALMGASFPLMGRLAIRSSDRAGDDTARFYAANTAGAAVGVLLASFVLLPALGLTGTLFVGAALDATAGALALALLSRAKPLARVTANEPTGRFRLSPRLWLASALCGASGLALEVVLTRLLVSLTGASVYAMALVLFVFLVGIALGSQAFSLALSESASTSSPPADARRLAARCSGAVALGALIGLVLLELRLGGLRGLSNLAPSAGGELRLWASHVFLAATVLLAPTLALGASLPAIVNAAAPTPGAVSQCLGKLYAANTAGAALGAFAAGFWLLPQLGVLPTAALACVPAGLAAALLFGSRWASTLALGVACFAVGAYLLRPAPERAEIVAEATGRVSTAMIERRLDGETLALRVNGKVVASTEGIDLRLQRLLGAIPGWLHGDVTDALVIGLGTGMTAGSLLELPGLARLDVFEISRSVLELAPHFAPWNGSLLQDPRTRVRLVDGRHALRRSSDRYDLITADPIHPWTRGSSDLYALEHFQAMADHLAPGGIASQWLPLYQLSTEDVRTIVATWRAAFPNTSAWLTAYDLVLVGALDRSVAPTPDEVPGPLPERLRRSLAEVGIADACSLTALLAGRDVDLAEFAGDLAPMLEDRPVLEFRAPRSFLKGTSKEAVAWSVRAEFASQRPSCARADAAWARSLALDFLAAPPDGWQAAAERYGAELLSGSN